MRKLEIAYLVYLVAIVISHLYFTFSVVFGQDTVYLMETKFSWVLLIYPIANLFWFVVHYYGFLEQFNKGFHSLSLITFFFAGFPVITSIVQGLAALAGIRYIPKQYKHIQHLNKLYQQKLEEMEQLSNWGLDVNTKDDGETEPDTLKQFLQRDIEQHGDEYQDYLNLDEEQAQEILESTVKQGDTKVVVGTKAYDVKEKMRREYDWLIPIYGVQVVEELSLDELMDLAVEEGDYDDEEILEDSDFTETDLEMPSFLERDTQTQESGYNDSSNHEDYSDDTTGELHDDEGHIEDDDDDSYRKSITPLTKQDGSEMYLEDLL